MTQTTGMAGKAESIIDVDIKDIRDAIECLNSAIGRNINRSRPVSLSEKPCIEKIDKNAPTQECSPLSSELKDIASRIREEVSRLEMATDRLQI